MKKRVAKWIGAVALSATAILIYLLLFQTHLFSTFAINLLNTYALNTYNISAKGNVHGGILSSTFGVNQALITINQGEDTLFYADKLQISGWETDWNNGEIVISQLAIDSYLFNAQYVNDISFPAIDRPSRSSLIIQQIHADKGDIALYLGDAIDTVSIDHLQGNLWRIDGFTGLEVTSSNISLPYLTGDSLDVVGLFGFDNTIKNVKNLHIRSSEFDILLNGQISDQDMLINLQGNQVNPHSIGGLSLPTMLADLLLDFDLDLYFHSTGMELGGTGLFSFDEIAYPFHLEHLRKSAIGESIALTVGSDLSNLSISASRDTNQVIEGFGKIFRLDLNPFIPLNTLQVDEPIGDFNFKGSDGKYNIATRLASFMVNGLEYDSLLADIELLPDASINFSHGNLRQKNNLLTFSGLINNDSIAFHTKLNLSDFSFMQKFNNLQQPEGRLDGEFDITGNLQSPRISGEFTPSGLGFSDKLKISGLGKLDFTYQAGSVFGNIALQGQQGSLVGDSLKSFTILGHITEDGYVIEDLHLQGTKNLVSLSGRFERNSLELSKMNMIIDQNQFRLADSVQVHRSTDGNFYLPPTVVVFNNGGLSFEGSYGYDPGFDLSASYELIDIEKVTQFLQLKTSFAGIATGTAQITGSLGDPVVHAQLMLKNGLTLGYPSDTANVDLILRSGSVFSNNIYATINDGSLNLKGSLPWGYKMRGDQYKTAGQNFSIVFDNYLLKDLNFTSIVEMPISGRATGALSLRGTPSATKLDGQLFITDAKFDTLSFTSAYADFIYEDNLLTFDSLSTISTWGYGSGIGTMPISLDMVAEDRTAVFDRDMGLNFEFILNEMPFLTSYISTIDAISGDFIGDLSFTGPMEAPIRNGKIRGHNATLEVALLGNPITDIHSEITLVDNTMSIDHFTGRMLFSEGSSLNIQGVVGRAASLITGLIGVSPAQDYAGVVSAEGSLDIHSFFRPIFDITVKAEEVYYRSSDGLIEAIADADIQVKGQDTLDVTAIIPVKRAVYYSNFETEELYQQSVSQNDTMQFRYNLNTQFSSDLLISNNQMEAEFEGELWLIDFGDGEMRFTGNLIAQEGGKFFYLGNELTIISGEINFHSVDFNPQLNMEAEIDIDGEQVSLVLSGDLNEPELLINVENSQLTQADVLTYLTINQTLVEVSFTTEDALNPVESYSVMLAEKELSKIGRQITGLDILDVVASDTTTVPRFQLGQRLSKNLKVTYEGELRATAGKSDYDFGFEYQINRNFSVTSKVNQNGEIELNGRLKFTY